MLIKPDKGPRSVTEWFDLPQLRKYNGEGGGHVFLHGALWKASWQGTLQKEQLVTVESLDGLHVYVKPLNN